MSFAVLPPAAQMTSGGSLSGKQFALGREEGEATGVWFALI